MKTKKLLKKWIAAGTIAAMVLCGTSGVFADGHTIAVDTGGDETNGAVGKVLSDILTSRGYTVLLTDDSGSGNQDAEIAIQLRTGGSSPVISMTVTGTEDVDSLSLAQSIEDAYTAISLGTRSEIPEVTDSTVSIPTAMIGLDLLKNQTAALDLEKDTDQAWAAYVIADGIGNYFGTSSEAEDGSATNTGSDEGEHSDTVDTDQEEEFSDSADAFTDAVSPEETEAGSGETAKADSQDAEAGSGSESAADSLKTGADAGESVEADSQDSVPGNAADENSGDAASGDEIDSQDKDSQDNTDTELQNGEAGSEKDAASGSRVKSRNKKNGSGDKAEAGSGDETENEDSTDTEDEAEAGSGDAAEADTDAEADTAQSDAQSGTVSANTEDFGSGAEAEPEVPEEQGTLSPSSAGDAAGPAQSEADLAAAQSQFKSAVTAAYSVLPQGNGRWAVYVCDLKNDLSGFAPPSANERMQSASLIKLFIMAAVYENFDSLSAAYGQSALDSNLYPMITVSDNDAANALVGMLGGGDSQAGMNVVNDFCTAHGYTSTHMGRLLLASNEFDDNYTSVVDCGRFLREIYRSAKAEADGEADSTGNIWTAPQVTATLSHATDMFNLLKAQTKQNKIPAAMPAGVQVANKTGELSNVENDAGIIYDTPNGSDLVIVFMSENLSATGDAQNAIANASRILYDAYH